MMTKCVQSAIGFSAKDLAIKSKYEYNARIQRRGSAVLFWPDRDGSVPIKVVEVSSSCMRWTRMR